MNRNYSQLLLGVVVGLIIGLLVGRQLFSKDVTAPAIPANQTTAHDENQNKPAVADERAKTNNQIPQKVYDVLKYIRAHNEPMPGYVGGRVFSNREELLPREDNQGKPILYHEWDVNPKVQGQNRGTERIITGSDGRAWYTNDHYQTFQQIK